MTDRELLELAAKAAGVDRLSLLPGSDYPDYQPWNPLTDDGDALRLAVACGIGLEFARLLVIAGRTRLHEDMRNHGDNMGSATRRAIVRAAAEIGRGMK